MFIKRSLILLAALLIVQPVLADEDMGMAGRPCSAVVKSCLNAGYGHRTEGKQFWKDCMRPLLLGKNVSGVTIEMKDVKICRTAKIKQLEKDLHDLKAANNQ